MSRTSLALALVVAAIPAIASAQSSTQTQQDSSRRGATRTQHSRGGDIDRDSSGNGSSRSRSSHGGSARFRGRSYGLNHDQVRQLQQAIDDRTQCDVGEADGVVGPKTRRALSCARKELGVQGNDMAELFNALGLDFASDDNGGNGQGNDRDRDMDRSSGDRAHRGNNRDNANRGNRANNGNGSNNGRDSTMRDSSRGQRPPR